MPRAGNRARHFFCSRDEELLPASAACPGTVLVRMGNRVSIDPPACLPFATMTLCIFHEGEYHE